jgi:hypothetical protein
MSTTNPFNFPESAQQVADELARHGIIVDGVTAWKEGSNGSLEVPAGGMVEIFDSVQPVCRVTVAVYDDELGVSRIDGQGRDYYWQNSDRFATVGDLLPSLRRAIAGEHPGNVEPTYGP